MPTGYTYPVKDGTVTDFPTFAMQCARAFGALIEMRDAPTDAEIPAEFQPSTYARDALAGAKVRLGHFLFLTDENAEREAAAHYAERLDAWKARSSARAVELERYRSMLAQVEAWQPPTPDHVGLHKFMIEQLTSSIKHDGGGDYDKEPQPETGAEYRDRAIREAKHNVAYYKKEWAEAQERAAGRNKWIADLRASLTSEVAS